MIKKLFKVLLVSIMVLSLIACNTSKPTTSDGIKDGTYTATTSGNNGDLSVEVVIANQKIEKVSVTDHVETPVLSDLAISDIPEKIVSTQSLGVDTVSGATVTSKAILDAVTLCLTEAGFDIETLKNVETTVEKAEDEVLDVDVVVIGAGGAGLAAAVTANQEGASVIVVEKMPKIGGNTILSGGAMNAVDEGSETAVKNKDSVDLHYKQTFEGGNEKADPTLVRTLVDNAWSAVEWMQSLGMEFEEETFTVLGGMWPRAHKPKAAVGTGFFIAFQEYVDTHENIEILLNTKAENLIIENGEVKGIVATGETGNKVTINANNAVVIATGGFGQNVEMREEYNTIWKDLGSSVKSTNHPGATGDGITLGLEANADLVGMEYIQLLPMGDPETGSLSGNIEKGVENRIFVNKEGNRFVDEGERRDVMTAALMEQTDAEMYTILDSHDYPTGDEYNNFHEKMSDLVKDGRAYKGETLEELAAQIGVDPTNLVNTVNEYNKFVAGEIEDPFGRTLKQDPIDQAPYYGALRVPTVHHTMGGLKIDTEAHVIDTNGNIIPGLYAAGEVTGGIHGANRLGGNALTDIIVFGRIAGKNAAADK